VCRFVLHSYLVASGVILTTFVPSFFSGLRILLPPYGALRSAVHRLPGIADVVVLAALAVRGMSTIDAGALGAAIRDLWSVMRGGEAGAGRGNLGIGMLGIVMKETAMKGRKDLPALTELGLPLGKMTGRKMTGRSLLLMITNTSFCAQFF
jgi:hypothetical protein